MVVMNRTISLLNKVENQLLAVTIALFKHYNCDHVRVSLARANLGESIYDYGTATVTTLGVENALKKTI